MDCSTGRGQTGRHDTLKELRSQNLKFKESKVARIYGREYCEERSYAEKEIQISRRPPVTALLNNKLYIHRVEDSREHTTRDM